MIIDNEIKKELIIKLQEITKLHILNSKRLLIEYKYNIEDVLIYIGSTENNLFPFILDYRDSEEVEKLREHYKNGNIKKYIKGLLR